MQKQINSQPEYLRRICWITLGFALTLYAVFSANSAQSSEKEIQIHAAVYEQKCKYLNDDKVWVIFCVLDMVANGSVPDETVIDKVPPPDQAKLTFDLESSWHNSEVFRSLSEQDRNSIYNFLRWDAPQYAYYEWACETQKYDNVRSDITNLINSIVSATSAKLLLQRRDEELDRMGYGMKHGTCEYDQFYATKKSFLKRRPAILALLKQSTM